MNTDRIMKAMNTRPTPETDAITGSADVWNAFEEEIIALARKLERERDEAREETIRTREFMDYGFAKAQEELTTVTAQRDRLAVALQEIAEGSSCCACRGAPELASIAGEALQSLTPNASAVAPATLDSASPKDVMAG